MKSKIIKVLYSSRTRRDFHSIYAGAMRYIWTPKPLDTTSATISSSNMTSRASISAP